MASARGVSGLLAWGVLGVLGSAGASAGPIMAGWAGVLATAPCARWGTTAPPSGHSIELGMSMSWQ